MIMKRILTFLCIIIILLSGLQLSSQNNNFEKGLLNNWSINVNIGNTQYFGDIKNSYNPFSLIKYNTAWAYGFMVSKQISPVFGIRTQFIKGRIKGRKESNASGTPANLSLYADYFEINMNTNVDLLNIIMDYNSERLINLYGIFGIGLNNLQGESKYYTTNKIIRSFGHGEGSGIGGWQVEGMLFAGGGAKVRLSNSFEANAEISFKFIGNDDIDGISGGFKYDSYSYNSIGISYKLGNAISKKKVIIQEPIIKDIEPEKITEPIVIDTIVEEPKVVEEVKKEEPIIIETKTIAPEPITIQTPIPLTNVSKEFKVQILASKTKVNTASIQKRFNINETIREDFDGTWYRYSVGSFQEFWKAKEEAKKLISKNKVYGAFVVGFKDNERLNSYLELLSGNEKTEIESTINDAKPEISNIGISYRVQLIALSKKMANESAFKQKYNINEDIFEEFLNNLYIYTAGNEMEYTKIVDLKNQIIRNGIKDAFIVTFKNNKRISILNK